MESEKNRAKDKKKDVFLLIKIRPGYVKEFYIMMLAFIELCKRYESENLVKIYKLWPVFGQFDFFLKLHRDEDDDCKNNDKIYRTIFRIRGVLGNYINETCTLTAYELPGFFTDRVKELNQEAENGYLGWEEYLFDWNNIPVKDGNKYLNYLMDDYDIDLTEKGSLKKSDDNKIISLQKDKNSINKIIISEEKKEKATLEIINDKTYNILVRKKNGRIFLKVFYDYLGAETSTRLCEFEKERISNTTKVDDTKNDRHKHIVLIKVKPAYTEKFFIAMNLFKSIYNASRPPELIETYYIIGPFDFLLKIGGNDEYEINKTILKFRETLGDYITETITIKKFKMSITKKELEELFKKIIDETYITKLPYKGEEKVPSDSDEFDHEINMKEICQVETTSLRHLLERSKNLYMSGSSNKQIDDLIQCIEEPKT